MCKAVVLGLLFMFFFLLFTTVLSQWHFSHGKYGLPSPGKASCYCMLGVLVFHNPPTSDMDNRILNVCRNVNACDCTRGFMATVRESALKVDSGRKVPCCTGESNLCWQRAGPMLYQLSYIPPMTYSLPSSHLSLICEGRWGITDDFATSFLHFSVFNCPRRLGELQA